MPMLNSWKLYHYLCRLVDGCSGWQLSFLQGAVIITAW
jgi:hypothetical protein